MQEPEHVAADRNFDDEHEPAHVAADRNFDDEHEPAHEHVAATPQTGLFNTRYDV